jgi:hypothetical protein
MNTIRLVALMWCIAICNPLKAGDTDAPGSFQTIEELRSWAQENKGFGNPTGVDFYRGSIRLYVTHNSPFSGRAGVYSYAYYLSEAEGRWKLIDSNFFEKKGVLSYVYVDNNKNDLVYVDFDGKVIKRFSLKDYSYK